MAKIISFCLSIAFVGYIFLERESLHQSLSTINVIYLPIIIIAQLMLQSSNALITSSSLVPFGKKIGFIESFKLTLVSSFFNFITPVVGGIGTRAVYLKKKYSISYSSYLGITYGNYIIIFIVCFIFGLIGVAMKLSASLSNFGIFLGLVFLVGLLVSATLAIYSHKAIILFKKIMTKNKIIASVLKKIILVLEGWLILKRDTKALKLIALWTFFATSASALIIWSAANAIGIRIDTASVLIFSTLACVSLVINVTPGNLGVREVIYASIFYLTTIGLEQVVAFSLLDRAIQIIILGIGWLMFGRHYIKSTIE